MRKTKCVEIDCRLVDTAAISCPVARGMLAHDGIQEVELCDSASLKVEAAKMLAEAMVCTACLKRLRLWRGNFRDKHVCAVLVEGLKRNRSLEEIELGGNLAELFRTISYHPNLRSLTLKCAKYIRRSYGGIARMAKP